jgi:hypothetical protein
MDIKTLNQTALTYTLNGETEEIVIKDNVENQDFIDLKLGDCQVTFPKAAIYELRLALQRYE